MPATASSRRAHQHARPHHLHATKPPVRRHAASAASTATTGARASNGHTKICVATGGATADRGALRRAALRAWAARPRPSAPARPRGLLRNLDKRLAGGGRSTSRPVRLRHLPARRLERRPQLTSGCGYPEPPNASHGRRRRLPTCRTSPRASTRSAHERVPLPRGRRTGGARHRAAADARCIHGVGARRRRLRGTWRSTGVGSSGRRARTSRSTATPRRCTALRRLGVNIALGTDWLPSGSMNLLRELACADSLNTHLLRRLLHRRRISG